jgi:hypothetical protein
VPDTLKDPKPKPDDGRSVIKSKPKGVSPSEVVLAPKKKAKPAPPSPWRFHPPASATDGAGNFVALDPVDAEHAADPEYWRDVVRPKLAAD